MTPHAYLCGGDVDIIIYMVTDMKKYIVYNIMHFFHPVKEIFILEIQWTVTNAFPLNTHLRLMRTILVPHHVKGID